MGHAVDKGVGGLIDIIFIYLYYRDLHVILLSCIQIQKKNLKRKFIFFSF